MRGEVWVNQARRLSYCWEVIYCWWAYDAEMMRAPSPATFGTFCFALLITVVKLFLEMTGDRASANPPGESWLCVAPRRCPRNLLNEYNEVSKLGFHWDWEVGGH